MAQIPNLQTPNRFQAPVPRSSSQIGSGKNLEMANHRDTEGTERRFSFARSGDDDRAKLLQLFGQHLSIPVNLFNSEALFISSREAVVRPALKGCDSQ